MANSFNSFIPKLSKYNDFEDEGYEESLFTSLISLLSTPKGTHPYDMNYGVSIRNYLFEIDKGNISSLIETDIMNSIELYIPTLVPLISVKVLRELNQSGYGFNYNVYIIIEDVIATFSITKQGTLVFKGARKWKTYKSWIHQVLDLNL